MTDKVQVAAEKDIDDAVAAARAAFPKWRETAGHKRAAIMNKFADLLEKNVDKLAKLESMAMGQPITVARAMIKAPAALWRYYAGYAGKVSGETFPPDEDGTYKIVQYEPLGVCAGICAWNGTHVLAAWKMAPAMAAGNTFILKTSEKSPLAAAAYGDILNEAGFPPGVINIVTGSGPVGSMLASHMDIAKIAFTGSAVAGRLVMQAAAKSNMKIVSLELGGKSPALVFDDAELDNAVQHTSTSFLRNSGQVCFASSRILVQEGIAPKYIEAVKKSMEDAATKMGDPSLDETAFGPLADKKQFERVMGFLQSARDEGVQVLVGGDRKGDTGTFVQPTVFLNPDLKSKVYTDEIFGPVISVRTFKDEEEAIRLANDTTYGLGCECRLAVPFKRAYLLTRTLQPPSTHPTSLGLFALPARSRLALLASILPLALRPRHHSVATSRVSRTPYQKTSETYADDFFFCALGGIGRESGPEGLKGYLQPKTIHINMNVPPRK